MKNVNYNDVMMEIITSAFSEKKGRLFLHCCCGVCASSVLERLAPYFEVTCYYYNPNIIDEKEYLLRAEQLKIFVERTRYAKDVIIPPFNPNEFFCSVSGLEQAKEGGARCEKCISLRLNKTFSEFSSIGGFDYFASTLSVSPLKNASLINSLGVEIGGEKFLVSDFKKNNGYTRSGELARQFGLYRQNFCGCKFSVR